MNLTGMGERFRELYRNTQYETDRREIEEAGERLEEADILDFLPEEYSGMDSDGAEENGSLIEVEEIRIGE